jgi:hypothetical protein
MMDLRKPETFDDESLDLALIGVAKLREVSRTGGVRDWSERVIAEAARRAEIRINRSEPGAVHDADWYASRQTEEQFLEETGA